MSTHFMTEGLIADGCLEGAGRSCLERSERRSSPSAFAADTAFLCAQRLLAAAGRETRRTSHCQKVWPD